MTLIERIRQLRRFAHPSAWRFLAFVATDPRWQPLYDSLARSTPAARFNEPVPWFTWHALRVLEQEIQERAGQAVLEWGMGGSTLWYQLNGLRVTAIESDSSWFAICRDRLGEEADLRLCQEPAAYARPDVDPSQFGVFVIDGRMRNECARFVADNILNGRIARDSLIVFDNTERPAYEEGIEALIDACRRHRSFSGPTASDIDHLTTLFWV